MPDGSPSPPPRRVVVTGATGFIGASLCRRLLAAGYAVTGLVRSEPPPSEAVPGVTYVRGDVREAGTLPPEPFAACDAVVHLVGIITEERGRGQTFQSVHVEGTRNVLAAAVRSGRRPHFLYLSAQGASPTSRAEYSRTKFAAERLAEEAGLPRTVFRPSVVLGPGAEFLTRMEGLIRRPPLSPFPPPFVPVPGNGKNRFQPVDVDDLAACVLAALDRPEAHGRVFEVGGADPVTFDELLRAIQERIGVRKPLLHIPLPFLFPLAAAMESLLPRPPVSVDQLYNLRADNVCDNTAIREVLGVSPRGFADTLTRCYAAGAEGQSRAGETG